jgi:signal peptidase I
LVKEEIMSSAKTRSASRIAAYAASGLLLLVVFANLFGIISLRIVQTNSMQGTIDTGDLVISQNWLKPNIGDIAIYHGHDLQGMKTGDVVHRVIAGDATNGFTFQGDNNQSADPELVPATDVVGVVSFWIPGVGALANPLVLAVLVSATAVIVLSRGYIKDAFGKINVWLSSRTARIRKLWITLLAVISLWLIFAGVGLVGLAKIEHPQAGPDLALGSSTQSLVLVLPHSNPSVGDLAIATIAGKRSLVRVEAIDANTLTVSSSMGKLLIARKDIDGPIRLVLPFIGALWLPFE